MTASNPAPWVEVDGVRVYCKADHADDTVTILDGLGIDWGATDPLADRQPATASFRLWDDPLGYWVSRATTQSVIGVPVVVGWTDGATTRVIFRGRVTTADLELARRTRNDHTTTRGWFVNVTATDKTTDLGNITFAANTTWPAESAVNRAVRLKQAATNGGMDIAEFYFEPDAVNWPMGLTDTSNKSVLTLTDEFYRSFGLGWDYRPDENVIRPRQPLKLSWYCFLFRLPGTQDRVISSGYFTTSGFGSDTAGYYHTVILGTDAGSTDDLMRLDRSSSVNRIELEYLRADGSKFRTIGARPATVRTPAQLSSWLNLDSPNQGNSARPFGHTWEVIDQAAYPAHPPIIWDTRHTGGFYGVEQAFALTRCAHTPAAVRVMSDPFAAALGTMADFQIVGGRVEYADHRWIVTLNPAWPSSRANTLTSWADFRANVDAATLTWSDPSARLHESVSWSDVRHVYGPGQPTPATQLP